MTRPDERAPRPRSNVPTLAGFARYFGGLLLASWVVWVVVEAYR